MISLLPLLLIALNPADDQRVAEWQARAQKHEAADEWCDALFYRRHALAVAADAATRYHAFLDAYAADQLRTAQALASELRVDSLGLNDDTTRKVALILDDLKSLATLDDAPCTHAVACGDGIVEGTEMCDARDASCTSQCELVAVVTEQEATEAPSRVVVHDEESPSPLPSLSRSPPQQPDRLLVIGAVMSGAGLIAAGTGAAIALANDQTLADPLTAGPFKERALEMRTGGWVAMGVGAAVAMAGGIAFGLAPNDDEREDADAGPVR